MKSSPFRKRYILLYSESMKSELREVEKDLNRVFRARRKYVEGDYCIFLTNQFYKKQFIDYVRDEMDGWETLVTSGSIKKCKSMIARRKDQELLKTKI